MELLVQLRLLHVECSVCPWLSQPRVRETLTDRWVPGFQRAGEQQGSPSCELALPCEATPSVCHKAHQPCHKHSHAPRASGGIWALDTSSVQPFNMFGVLVCHRLTFENWGVVYSVWPCTHQWTFLPLTFTSLHEVTPKYIQIKKAFNILVSRNSLSCVRIGNSANH